MHHLVPSEAVDLAGISKKEEWNVRGVTNLFRAVRNWRRNSIDILPSVNERDSYCVQLKTN